MQDVQAKKYLVQTSSLHTIYERSFWIHMQCMLIIPGEVVSFIWFLKYVFRQRV